MRDGRTFEGTLNIKSLPLVVDGKRRDIPLTDLLSLNTGSPASDTEGHTIADDLALFAGGNHVAIEQAVEELEGIGLPVLTPLLKTYKDTDLHEPNPLYHLYGRLIDGYADSLDRSLDLVRLANGEDLRGKLQLEAVKITDETAGVQTIAGTEIRSLAVRRPEIAKVFDVQALRNCTPIAFLDTGISLSANSSLEESTKGFVRLSFDIDGWASDSDGIRKPGPNYTTNLVEGFPFGALVGRVGAAGSRWFAGHHVEKTNPGKGRLYFAVNDNGHWQNNVGSFRVTLHVTEAYDLGDPR